MSMIRPMSVLLGMLACGTVSLAGAGNNSIVSFDEGNEGWVLNGWDQPDAAGGNPGANLHWDNFVDTFGMEARTSSNAAFLGDYSRFTQGARVSIDFQVDFIAFFGTPVDRDLTLQLRDFDSFNGADPATVWINLGLLPQQADGWRTFSVDITDVTSTALPAGWQGAGAEDPNTFEPVLPAGRNWANVLQGVDEIAFSTFVPGFFYGFTNFKLRVDNIRIEAIPTPASAMLMLGAGLTMLPRRRHH